MKIREGYSRDDMEGGRDLREISKGKRHFLDVRSLDRGHSLEFLFRGEAVEDADMTDLEADMAAGGPGLAAQVDVRRDHYMAKGPDSTPGLVVAYLRLEVEDS
ncbi:hypothetical protein H2202_011194, partial [Exophiala xenobiotica]